jgi:hypothetical protein
MLSVFRLGPLYQSRKWVAVLIYKGSHRDFKLHNIHRIWRFFRVWFASKFAAKSGYEAMAIEDGLG